jgi:hypothetical protein
MSKKGKNRCSRGGVSLFSPFPFNFKFSSSFFKSQRTSTTRAVPSMRVRNHISYHYPWQHSIDRRQWCLLRPVSQFTCPPSQGAFDSDSSFWAALPQHDCFRTIIRQIHVRFRRSRSSSTEGVGWVGVAHRVRREVVSTLDGGGAVGVRGA